MTEERRYETEVRPVVFKILNGLEAYVNRVGIKPAELERALIDWIIERARERTDEG